MTVSPHQPSLIPDIKYNTTTIGLVVVIVILVIALLGIGIAYSGKHDPVSIQTTLATVTETQQIGGPNGQTPKELYLTYVSHELFYYIGPQNQTGVYNISASVTAASIKFQNRSATVSYYLVYPTTPKETWQPLYSFVTGGNITHFVINMTSLFSASNTIETDLNYSATPVSIIMNITATPNNTPKSENIYSVTIGTISFQTPQGDYIEMYPFNLEQQAIP